MFLSRKFLSLTVRSCFREFVVLGNVELVEVTENVNVLGDKERQIFGGLSARTIRVQIVF